MPGDVSTQVLGTGLFNTNPVTVYEFTAPIPDFAASAATTYWLSIRSSAQDFDPLFSWIQGTGGNNASYQTAFTNGVVTNEFVRQGDRAFSLSTVPEPATLSLLALGLAGVSFMRKRKAS